MCLHYKQCFLHPGSCFSFLFLFLLLAVIHPSSASGQTCQLSESQLITAPAADIVHNANFGWSITIDGPVMVVGAPIASLSGSTNGAAYIYRFDGVDWNLEQTLVSPDSQPLDADFFGWSVAVRGNEVVVGARTAKDLSGIVITGAAYLFQFNGTNGTWDGGMRLVADLNTPEEFDDLGYAVSLDGDLIVVGSPLDNLVGGLDDAGSAYIFERDLGGANNWGNRAYLTASDGAFDDRFGQSVAISGDTVLIGAPLDDNVVGSDAGSAYVFLRDSGAQDAWGQTQKLTGANTGPTNDLFGTSVALSEINAVVGAPFDDTAGVNAGALYPYIRNPAINFLVPLPILTATDPGVDDHIGMSASIDGDFLVGGSFLATNNLGRALAFVWSPGWTEYLKLRPSNIISGIRFGNGVAVSGGAFAVGANGFPVGADLAGAGYVFEASGAGDCNGNLIPDSCDITSGFSVDCNGNGVPDDCDIINGTSEDCNGNGVPDDCDLSSGTSQDCNGNGLPDDCDIASGFSGDCNGNGVPDECPVDIPTWDCNGNGIHDCVEIATGISVDCNGNGVPDECDLHENVDIVFIFDTSGSMQNEAGLCMEMNDVVNQLSANGFVVNASFLSISNTSIFPCLTDTVVNLFGAFVPSPPSCCPSITTLEDWGPATSIVADRYPWVSLPMRVIVPISDEGPWQGNPCNDPGDDRDTITNAIDIANLNGVNVFPISGIGSLPCVQTLMQDLGAGTQGQWFDATSPTLVIDMVNAITDLFVPIIVDCTGNGIPDDCETDCNANGVADSCELFCVADIVPLSSSGNCTVNIDDLVAVLTGFGPCSAPPALCPADITPPGGNGVVNIDDLVMVLTEFGPCDSGPGGGGINGITLEAMNFSDGWMDENGVIDSASAVLVAGEWLTYQNQWDVYRLWVTVDDQYSTLTFAGGGVASGVGGTSEPLVLNSGKNGAFYVPSGNYSQGVNVALLAFDGGPGLDWFQTQAFGTYLAMGTASNGIVPGKMGDTAALDGILTGSVNEANTGWSVIGPAAGQGVVPDGNGGWRVLIGQFAVPEGESFTAAVRLVGDDVDTYATISSGTPLP